MAIVDGNLFILDMRHFRGNTDEVERRVLQTAMEDGPNVKIRMEQEPGQSGKSQISNYSRNILLGYDFAGNPAVNKKAMRVGNWAGKVKRREVFLVRGDWVTDFLDEAVAFDPNAGKSSKVHDDQMDAVSGGFEILTGITGKQKRRVQLIL